MNILDTVSIIGWIILLGGIAEYLFNKKKIPSVIWLLLFGVILNFFNVFNQSDFIIFSGLISSIAIILIMFEGGLSFNVIDIIHYAKDGFILMLLSFLIGVIMITIIVYVLSPVLGFPDPFMYGILLAAVLGGTSASVVFPIIQNMNISNKVKTTLMMESVADTFSFVIVFLILQIMSLSSLPSFGLQMILNPSLTGIALGIFVGLTFIPLNYFIKDSKLLYFIMVGLLFIFYSITENVGGSGLLAMFTAGLIIGNLKFLKKYVPVLPIGGKKILIKEYHSIITFFIKTFFFVYMGLVVMLTDYLSILVGILLTLALIVSKGLSVLTFLKYTKRYTPYELDVITCTIPRGLSTAVLAFLPLSYGIPMAEVFPNIVFIVILLSVMFTSIGINIIPNLRKRKA